VRLHVGLRRYATGGRIATALLLLPIPGLLSSCWEWEVAGPLLGVGATGAGVAVANDRSQHRQSRASTGQSNIETVVRSVPSQLSGQYHELSDYNSGPAVAHLTEAALSASPAHTLAATKAPATAGQYHHSTRSVAHSGRQRASLAHKSNPATDAQPFSVPSMFTVLPPTSIVQ
jgi:hypothetical protein